MSEEQEQQKTETSIDSVSNEIPQQKSILTGGYYAIVRLSDTVSQEYLPDQHFGTEIGLYWSASQSGLKKILGSLIGVTVLAVFRGRAIPFTIKQSIAFTK